MAKQAYPRAMRGPDKYCESLTAYRRLVTREVMVGNVPLGGSHPIRLQSMTNTSTLDTAATVSQIMRIADAGADYVRMTTRSVREAKNLRNIREELRSHEYRIPLVADVHFSPDIAEIAAREVDKIRINPGNYAIDSIRKGDYREIKERFTHLLEICKARQTALRIGVNHGSLSQRIMDKYGDTPRGMTESALEFIRMGEEAHFHNMVISMKSSNTRVMVQANRLLVHQMLRRANVYPLHLGVTEAGEGEDGRIKSALGIGTLLNDGIGDTIRVSLTESPEKELPVASAIVYYASQRDDQARIPELQTLPIDPFDYGRRSSQPLSLAGGEKPPVVVTRGAPPRSLPRGLKPDLIITGYRATTDETGDIPVATDYQQWLDRKKPPNSHPLFESISHYLARKPEGKGPHLVQVTIDELEETKQLKGRCGIILLLRPTTSHPTAEQRRFIFGLMNRELNMPVIVSGHYREQGVQDFQIKAAADLGPLFIDGLADGLLIDNEGPLHHRQILNLSYGILQASRSRIYKTEFISCPGCGRTQFDLEKTAESIRRRMGHLRGLKIAVMGCIVNGPGEMADADYGYVGSGPGKITLYRNRQVVKRNIPEDQAVEELIKLIKDYGDWKEQ